MCFWKPSHNSLFRPKNSSKKSPKLNIFVFPKAPRIGGFPFVSLWILGDLDSSCVIKLSLLRSEDSDLLSDSQMSQWKSLLAKVDPEWASKRNIFVLPKDPRLLRFSLRSLWILGELDSSCVIKLSLLRSEVSDLCFGSQMFHWKPEKTGMGTVPPHSRI